ncbi:ATP-grasp fold amidoligase family protein [Devosia sp. A16]|uniref:ATP-grasp fold amidoligase family protein n=1 Tax=Devosia sp. A16 TaxID=1736675 RepID=UPI0009E8E0F6|nr:ATP-grasp fold amidoligase family protein [Devosia sp. A16]
MTTSPTRVQPPKLLRLLEIASTRRDMERRFQRAFGRLPDLSHPRTFNERMLHRLVYDRDPLFTVFSDKIAAKDYIARRVGPGYNVPLLGKWSTPRQIDWAALPERFVLKPSGDSGRFVLVRGPAERNPDHLRAIAWSWLKTRRAGRRHAEWGYRGVPRQLLAEPLLVGPDGGTPPEINVLTFGGKAKLIRRFTGRKTLPERRDAWFDATGRQVEIGVVSIASVRMELPESLRLELIEVAEALSDGLDHLRVDFYLTGDGLRVGELTPYSWGGMAHWRSPDLDEKMGRLWAGENDYAIFDDFRDPDPAGVPPADTATWLKTWEQLINAGDYASARQLFATDVVAFGSLAETMNGLDALEQQQWRKIWGSNREFAFEAPAMVSASDGASTVALRWHSKGMTEDGGWYERRGRCTLVLERRGRGLVCTHSHFSMDPGIPPRRSE